MNLIIKAKLCVSCYFWCKEWIISQKGFYRYTFIGEALVEMRKPVPCRFKDMCGNDVSRFKEDGTLDKRKKRLCEKCRPIWEAGFKCGMNYVRKNRNPERIVMYDFQKRD